MASPILSFCSRHAHFSKSETCTKCYPNMAHRNHDIVYPKYPSMNTAGPYFAPVAHMYSPTTHTSSPGPSSHYDGMTRRASQLRISSTIPSLLWATPLNTKFAPGSQDDYPDRVALSPIAQINLYAPIHIDSDPEDLALSDDEVQLNRRPAKHVTKRKRGSDLEPRKRQAVEYSSHTKELSNSALMELCQQRGLVIREEKRVEDAVPITRKRKAQESSIEDEDPLPSRRRKVQFSSTSAPQPVAVTGDADSLELSDLSDTINSDSDEYQPATSRGKRRQAAKGEKKVRRSTRARAKVSYY